MASRIISSSRAGLGVVVATDNSSAQSQVISNVGVYVSPHTSTTYPVTLTQNFTVHPSFVKIPATLVQGFTIHPSFGAIKEVLLQHFTFHDAPPVLQKPPVMFDRATIGDALHSVTTATARDGFKVSLQSATNTQYHYNLINRIFLRPTQFPAWNAVIALTQNLTISLSASQKYIWGRVLRQALRLSDAIGTTGHYSVALAQLFKLASAFSRIFPQVLSQEVTVAPAQAAALRLRLLQNVLVALSSSPVFTYHLTLASRVIIGEILSQSRHFILSQLFTIHDAPGRQFISNNSLAQLLTVHPAFTNKLVLQVVGNLSVSPSQLVHMIYAGDPLLDGVVITALYISPSGTTTTWAVNTRTNAVTEYMNYNFRSFALLGNRYIAAGAGGLYELEGDTDAGASIVGDLMGGYLQLNEKKLFGIKGAYVAIRGGGRFYLRLIGGDGREYTYELRAQPNLMTTKIKVGKGLSTTYMAWELVTEGQDFDLDSIEFIPMTRGRRV